jgi:hypothetical protein
VRGGSRPGGAESEVLAANSARNRQVARALFVTTNTVEVPLSSA